jgi:hypothetical protein
LPISSAVFVIRVRLKSAVKIAESSFVISSKHLLPPSGDIATRLDARTAPEKNN